MKIEYIISIDKKTRRATNTKSFLKSIEVSEGIVVDCDKKKMNFNNKDFSYSIQEKSNDKSVFYHLTIESPEVEPFDLDNDIVKAFEKLATQIECAVRDCHGFYEVVWNDINFKCSQLAYPKIYEIENLFRKLISKFMLFNVGQGWENSFVPNDISKNMDSDKAKSRDGGLMYKLDFNQINTFLFGEKSEEADLKKLWDLKGKDNIQFSDIEKYLPQRNWERFFKSEIDIDDKELEKQWKELYELRCKIAHNNIFTPDDLKRVDKLINQIKPAIETSIINMSGCNSLEKVNFDSEDYQVYYYMKKLKEIYSDCLNCLNYYKG